MLVAIHGCKKEIDQSKTKRRKQAQTELNERLDATVRAEIKRKRNKQREGAECGGGAARRRDKSNREQPKRPDCRLKTVLQKEIDAQKPRGSTRDRRSAGSGQNRRAPPEPDGAPP